ncbi:MAG: DUF2798 domain-containing protein [Rhizobiaceae bacterium]|nr:DUF2798 domain-containing protein [Rhizobiaceae bacterium]
MSVPAMRPFLPKRLEPVAFGFLLLGMMSLIVSGMATVLAVGIHSGFVFQWLTAWAPSWAIAFPAVLVVAPVVRRILKRIVQDP